MADARIWPSTDGPDSKAVEGEYVTLGLKAKCTANGVVLKKLYYYRPADLTVGTRRAVVYQVGNSTPLVNEVFPDTDGTGFKWQSFTLSTPLALTNGQDYYFCTAYSEDGGGYAATQFYFDSGPGASGFNVGGMVYVYHGGDITPEPGQSLYVVTSPSPGPAVPVNSFRDTNYWNDFLVGTATTEVTKSLSTQWNVRAIVPDSLSTQWNVRSALAKSCTLAWSVRQAPAVSRSTEWNIRAAVNKNRDVSWSVYRAVTDAIQAEWNARQIVTDPIPTRWHVAETVGVSLDTEWNVFSDTTVAKSLAVQWGVRASIVDSLDIDWAVREAVLSDRDIAWGVTSIVADSIASEWSVRLAIARAQSIRWNVLSNNATPQTLLRLHLNGAWVAVPVKVHDGSAWVEVPVRSYDPGTGTWV